MSDQEQIVKNRLFGKDSLSVSNVKMCPGDRRDVTPADVARELNKALSQIESDECETKIY